MSIHVNEEHQLFHLQTANTSYIFHVMVNGDAGQLYYGTKIPVKADYVNLDTHEEHDCTNTLTDEQTDFQLELLKQEYASFGKGDFRYPAFQLTNPDGSRISEFKFNHYELTNGKERLDGQPSAFASDKDDSQTLKLHFLDEVNQVELVLNYTVFENEDVIVRSSNFINHGSPVELNRALSMQLDLPDHQYDMVQFDGSWARERHLHRSLLRYGTKQKQLTAALRPPIEPLLYVSPSSYWQ